MKIELHRDNLGAKKNELSFQADFYDEAYRMTTERERKSNALGWNVH